MAESDEYLKLERELSSLYEYGISVSPYPAGVEGPQDSPIFTGFNGNPFVDKTLYYLWWRLRGYDWIEAQRDPIEYRTPGKSTDTWDDTMKRGNLTTQPTIIFNDLTTEKLFISDPTPAVGTDKRKFLVYNEETLEAEPVTRLQAQAMLDFVGTPGTPTNQAPVNASLTNQTTSVGADFNYTIPAATDAEGAPLSYAVTGLPPGLTFQSGSNTRKVVGKATQAGVYTITLITTDPAGATDTDSFTITVGAAAHILLWTEIAYDPEEKEITLTVDSSLDPDDYPVEYAVPGIRGYSTDNVFTVPEYQSNGVTFSVHARQTGPSGEELTLDGSVTTYLSSNPNAAPVFAAQPNLAGTVGVPFSQQLVTATDADNDLLTYSVVGTLPSGLVFNPATRTIQGTPLQAGTVTLVYRTSDGKASPVTQNFTLTIAAGATPSLVRVFGRFVYNRSVVTSDAGIAIGGASTSPYLGHILLIQAQGVPAGGKVQTGIKVLDPGQSAGDVAYTWQNTYGGNPPAGYTHYQGNNTGPRYVGGTTIYAVRIIDATGNTVAGPVEVYTRDNGSTTDQSDYSQLYPATSVVLDSTTRLTVSNPDPNNPIFSPQLAWVTGPDGRQWGRITDNNTTTAVYGWKWTANGRPLVSGSLGNAATYPPYSLITLEKCDAQTFEPIGDAGYDRKAQLIIRLGDSGGSIITQSL